MDKSKRTKSKQKPVATSIISQPAVNDSSVETTLSAFSDDGKLFALVSLALDKHRLRIHDTSTGISSSEYIIETSDVSHLSWGSVSMLSDVPPQKKKRRKRSSTTPDDLQVVFLGLRNGSILLFSPSHSRVLSTLSSATTSSAVLAITVSVDKSSLWVSNHDGLIHLWNISSAAIVGSWKSDDSSPLSSILLRSQNPDEDPELLVASHKIEMLSLLNSSDPSTISTAEKLSTFTGHASPISILRWDTSQTPPTRFFSAAKGDRVLCLWEVPDNEEEEEEGKMVASIPIEASPRSVSYATHSKQNVLMTVDAAGKLLLFPIPNELVVPASSGSTPSKIPTLLPRTVVSVSSKRASPSATIIDAVFLPDSQNKIIVARLASGVKPVFDICTFLDNSGHHISEVKLDDVTAELLAKGEQLASLPNKRYAESNNVAIRSAAELGLDEEMDGLEDRDIEGNLDVDLAELSLGQRLAAISREPVEKDASSSSEAEDAEPSSSKQGKKRKEKEVTAVPASSLTRTLIQALHSSDSKLLETCLAHSDAALIRNTVRMLPPQLAVPLLNACVERLGRGSRAGNMKGRGGGASAQRGTTLVEWVKATLVVHSGHLMSMPDLVARLSKLHSTLTTRLALQESLVSLSGRLDMVLTQIELRASGAPSIANGTSASQKKGSSKAFHYVEGESDEDDAEMEDVEDGDDGGSVEDVELGGDDDEGDSIEDSDEDDDDELYQDDDEGPTLNGFIDDEAEEEYSEDDDIDSD